MEHIAILSKEKKFLDKILSGEKKIESRWYVHKKPPYNSIKRAEIIYFKESGQPIKIKAEVEQVLFIENLNIEKIKQIIKKYGKEICINMDYLNDIKDKKYCTLIFLKNVKGIKPFDINKNGFGNMAAWIIVEDINKIKQ